MAGSVVLSLRLRTKANANASVLVTWTRYVTRQDVSRAVVFVVDGPPPSIPGQHVDRHRELPRNVGPSVIVAPSLQETRSRGEYPQDDSGGPDLRGKETTGELLFDRA